MKSAGFTLTEVLVGVALMLIIFLGIFGAYQLGLRVISQSRLRTIATALANQKIEQIRNLPYNAIGIQGGSPGGDLESIQTITKNDVEFVIETIIDYVVDEADGLASPEDNCIYDYKRARVTVSYLNRFSGEVSLATDIAPKNEVQECEETGGILWAKVFNAKGEKVTNAQVSVRDIISGLTKTCITSLDQKCYVPLPTSETSENYKIEVSRSGYSTDLTFGAGEVYDSYTITTPEKPNATILEGQITEKSFSIDSLANFSVTTKSSRGKESFKDEFNNKNLVSEYSNIETNEGKVMLSKTNGDFTSSGYLVSVEISPSNLVSWYQFSFLDTEPQDTDILYQFFYYQLSGWVLVPDTDLAGNSAGFDDSPVDLSGLDTSLYPKLKVRGNLSTSNLQQSPALDEWEVHYLTKVSYFLANIPFHLRGLKTVGTDSEEQPIYKYSKGHSSDSSGQINISNLEWDSYNFSVDKVVTGLDLIEIEPEPQPLGLEPGVNQSVVLYLAAENTLLVKVKDADTGDPVFSASVRLYKMDFDKGQFTDQNGETFFMPLEAASYNLEVTAEGYQSYTGQVSVAGDTTITVNLTLSPQ